MAFTSIEAIAQKLEDDRKERLESILIVSGSEAIAKNKYNITVVDDTNVKGYTIGQRRLNTPHKNLYELRHMIDNFVDLSRHRRKFFVDSNGKFFRYEKSITAKLYYFKIKEVIEKDIITLIYVENVPFPFELKNLYST